MDILIIGNGFDLAHGLKTSYKDFLDSRYFIKFRRMIFSYNKVHLFFNKVSTYETLLNLLYNFTAL